jgi:hypothetical protein
MRHFCVPWRLASTVAVLAGLAAGALTLGGSAGAGTAQPDFLLPWEDGVAWKTGTAGFHGTGDALDFFPPDSPPSSELICKGEPGWYEAISAYWALASAAGTVTQAERPYVTIDHGGGWSSRYLHLTDIAVSVGQQVGAGAPLGHPSTYGFCTTGPHVHFSVLGPNGQTTRHVTLSGVPADQIGGNETITLTGNVPGGGGPTPPPTPAPTPGGSVVSGDTDCDGDVDSVDGLFVLLEVGGIAAGACVQQAADVNCSGAIDAVDALQVMRHIAALPVSVPAGCAAIGTAR